MRLVKIQRSAVSRLAAFHQAPLARCYTARTGAPNPPADCRREVYEATGYADCDGPAFEAYYCPNCAARLRAATPVAAAPGREAGFFVAEIVPAVLLLVALVILGLTASADVKAKREWKAWAADHCTVVGHMDGDVVTGFGVSAGGNAVVTTSSTPAKTGYLCDDGITYWK